MSYQFAIRIDDDMLARVDALVPKLKTPWHEATRTDVLRAAIEQGLPILEDMGEHMPKPKRGKR